jgi:hypothetical protein
MVTNILCLGQIVRRTIEVGVCAFDLMIMLSELCQSHCLCVFLIWKCALLMFCPVMYHSDYRPPSSDTDSDAVAYNREMCDCISGLISNNGSTIICGDFNLPYINWSLDNSLKCSESTCSGIFLDLYYAHGFHQYVSEPTRYDHTLDIVLCNDVNRIFNTRVLPPFSTSDHCSVGFDVICN